jgi:hypothetical protein
MTSSGMLCLRKLVCRAKGSERERTQAREGETNWIRSQHDRLLYVYVYLYPYVLISSSEVAYIQEVGAVPVYENVRKYKECQCLCF